MSSENVIPRRADVSRYTPAEEAIRKAVDEVEKMGADTGLTEAVILLGAAKDHVADYVDNIPFKHKYSPVNSNPIIELPVCAAIKVGNDLFLGKRHADCIMQVMRTGNYKERIYLEHQGFFTNKGNFVSREFAYLLRKNAGLPSADPEGYRGNQLFSEDLY